jgi:hypothetical protein
VKSIRSFLKYFVPHQFVKTRRDYLISKRLVKTNYQYNNQNKSGFSHAFDSLRLLSAPKKTISFYPEVPGLRAVIFDLCAFLKYKVVQGPCPEADCEMLFDDSTFSKLADFADAFKDPASVINGECSDISKVNVQHCFRKAFGYPLGINPATYRGPILKKSNKNYTHDGKIIQGPINPSEQDNQYVYQKAIDNRTADGYYLDFRVPVCGRKIPLVYKKYRPPEKRFTDVSHSEIAEPDEIFTQTELNQILTFTEHLNMDFGELDVLRDNHDDKIYIVDANKTPYHSSLSGDLKKGLLLNLQKLLNN